jgi:hypothetical protein
MPIQPYELWADADSSFNLVKAVMVRTLAQRTVDHGTHNPLVPCSTHGRPTKFISKNKGLAFVLALFISISCCHVQFLSSSFFPTCLMFMIMSECQLISDAV